MSHRPSLRNVARNWQSHDGSFAEKVRMLVRNNVKKVATLSHCCGRPGEPGC